MADPTTLETRQFQADQMRDIAQGIRDFAQEVAHATRVEEFTHVAWHLHRTYALVNRLTECFYDHETHALDMPSIARWRRELFKVAQYKLLRSLSKAHGMEFCELVYGTDDWNWYVESFIGDLDQASSRMDILVNRWTKEYLTVAGSEKKS